MIKRKTDETEISLDLEGDSISITTGVTLFDHFLYQMAKHGGFKLELTATGDNIHHIIEDVGICLGQAFLELKRGRIGHSIVPMDDALAMVAVDFSDRGYAQIQIPFIGDVNGLSSEIITHFLEVFAREGRFNLHVIVLDGHNDHHIVEAIFKALGRAFRNKQD